MTEDDTNWIFMVARTVVEGIHGEVGQLSMLADERVKAVMQSLLTVESTMQMEVIEEDGHLVNLLPMKHFDLSTVVNGA